MTLGKEGLVRCQIPLREFGSTRVENGGPCAIKETRSTGNAALEGQLEFDPKYLQRRTDVSRLIRTHVLRRRLLLNAMLISSTLRVRSRKRVVPGSASQFVSV